MAARVGRVRPLTFYVECPHCEQGVNLETITTDGASDIRTGDNDLNYKAGLVVTCEECGGKVKLPEYWK